MTKGKFNPHIRNVPFDLSKCFERYPDIASFLKDASALPGGMPWVLNRVGMSFVTEYMELQMHYVHNLYPPEDVNPDVDVFLKQELRHSAYHNALNKYIEPTYLRMKYGPPRINALLYPHIAHDELIYRKINHPSSKEELAETYKMIDFKLACFETHIGVFSAMANFQVLEEHFDEVKDIVPFYLYVWYYHWTEELEHVHLALQWYEEKYHTNLLSHGHIDQVLGELDHGSMMYNSIGIGIGLKHGIRIDYKDVLETPARQKMATLKAKFKRGYNLSDLKDMRLHYIELFDKKWEPILRKSVENWSMAA